MISVAGARFGTVDLVGLSAYGGSVAYASYGPEDAPAVMVLGGISAHRFVCGDEDGTPGWWPGVVGLGAPLDPTNYRVVGVDYIGGAGASSVSLSGRGGPGGDHRRSSRRSEGCTRPPRRRKATRVGRCVLRRDGGPGLWGTPLGPPGAAIGLLCGTQISSHGHRPERPPAPDRQAGRRGGAGIRGTGSGA